MKLYIDFETRSTVDLTEVDSFNYVSHPTTEVICYGYAFGDEAVQIVKRGEPVPDAVLTHVKAGLPVVAHNISFDRAVWNHLVRPDCSITLEQSFDTMAKCSQAGIPRSLKKAGEYLNLPFKKLAVGQVLINKLSRPKSVSPLVWFEREDALEAMYEYCKQDVETCRSLDKALPDLSDDEHRVWILNETVNGRGLRCDLDFVRHSVRLVAEAKSDLDNQIKAITGGAVGACSEVKKLTEWVQAQGVAVESINKDGVVKALAKNPPEHVKEALTMRQEYAKSSTAKLAKIIDTIAPDGRLRNQFVYYGAGTGRFSGRGAQPQNLPRLGCKPEEAVGLVALINTGDKQTIEQRFGPVLKAVSSVLRCVIQASPGKVLMGGDFSAIEARIVAWLAGQNDMLDVFRRDEDVYCHAASKIFGRQITPKDERERFIGKVATLALGYQGSTGAFDNMARNYGLELPLDEQKRIVKLWRESNPSIVKYWRQVEDAAVHAVEKPGTTAVAGRAGCLSLFRCDGEFLKIKLPSGRILYYPRPQVTEAFKFGRWGKRLSYDGQIPGKALFGRIETYGGSLVENITQAVARDIMVAAMFRVEERGWPLVATVHDELLCEVPEGSIDPVEFEAVMAATPDWARDLPMSVKVFSGPRYLKT